MRPVRIIAAVLLAAMVGTLTLLGGPAWAAPMIIDVSPASVDAGDTVTASGSVGPDAASSECSSGAVALYSNAFAPTNDPGDLAALYPLVKPTGTFTATTTILRSKPAGTYPIHLRCGGATLGSATLLVRATTPGLSVVSLGGHRFGHLRAPDAIVARAGPHEVGFWAPPDGQDGATFGPWSFDVAQDGSIWLLDKVNQQLLVWQPGQPDHPARKVPLPLDPLERVADFAVAPDHTIYATYVPPPGPGPKTLRLCALSPSGQVRWTAATIDEIFNAPLRIGPDGALWVFGGLFGQGWTPLTTPAGRPLPLAEQHRRTSPQQPLPGGQRLTAIHPAIGGEWRFTLSDRAGQLLHAWRITSQTDLGSLGATPALVGGDPVVVIEVSRQTTAKFLYEYQVLRLDRGGGASVRFAINPTGRAMWGSEFVTGVRVGSDGQLYQLRTDRATGASIARYSLDPTKATPPTSAPTPIPSPAPGPSIDHGGQTLPPVTVPPAQPATPAGTDPAGSQWLLPSLVAVGASLLAGVGMWLLYRHRHPASPGPHSKSRMAR